MKWLLFLILLFVSSNTFAQTIFNYRYTEVCSGRTNTVKVVLNNNSDFFTVFFFGENKTFSKLDYFNGTYDVWMDDVYTKWTNYYPCQEVLSLIQETSKRVAGKGSKEVAQPVIVVSSDLAFFTPNEFRIGSSWSETDRITKASSGGLGTFGNGKVYAVGYFLLNPIIPNLNSVQNYNIILADGSLLGNLINGVYYELNSNGIFGFSSITFGNMNGFSFQNNGILVGGIYDIYKGNQFSFKGVLVVSYTYYEKIFDLTYWFDNSVKINPNITMSYKLSPTFGFSITANTTYRIGRNNGLLNFGILSGAKLFF